MEYFPETASVAIVIVTWNCADLLEKVLTCVARQTVPPQQVLIVDNNSDDIEKLRLVVAKFPSYELHEMSENLGFAAANNWAVNMAKPSEFVALLNPDAYVMESWLAQLLNEAIRYPSAAAFGSRLLKADSPEILDGAGDYLSITGKPGRIGHGKRTTSQFEKSTAIFSPCAAAALYRRHAFESIGGFDVEFFCYVEDVDLAFRLLLAGYGSRYVGSAVALHVGSASTGVRSDFAVYYGQRNLVFNFVKNMPSPLFWAFLLPHILVNIGYVIAALFVGLGGPVWRAKCDACRHLPRLWQQRRILQRNKASASLVVARRLRWSLW